MLGSKMLKTLWYTVSDTFCTEYRLL